MRRDAASTRPIRPSTGRRPMRLHGMSLIAAAAALTQAGIRLPAAAAPPTETVANAFREAIPNVPGKSLVAVVVRYEPGGQSAPHHHARNAFITGNVLTGAVRSQVNDEPARVYRTGERWTEAPGAHLSVSENASTTEPASLLAIFVVDSSETELTIPGP